jgi:hypothetical protein
LVELIFETFLTDDEDICDVSEVEEIFHIVEAIRLGVRVRELGVDLGLTQCFASHLKVADEVVMFTRVVSDFDDFCKVRRVFCLDVRVWQYDEVLSKLGQ